MFYAIPEFSTSSGTPVNAVFGMAKFFLGQISQEKPDILVFIQDAAWENFRHTLYQEYKGTRERMPDQLRQQMPIIEEMLGVLWFPILQKTGYEADDIIATLATQLQQDEKNDIFILSGDKDLFALVNKNVKIYDTMRKQIYDEEKTKEKFAVAACCVTDYLAIVWDSSDNIPGIAGFWPKKAIQLLEWYPTVEEIFFHLHDADFPLSEKLRNALAQQKEIAYLSKKLATLEKQVPLDDFFLPQFAFASENLHTPKVQEFFEKYEFSSLITKKTEKKRMWHDIAKEIHIIADADSLNQLIKDISKKEEIILTTRTKNADDMHSKLLWVWIQLSKDDIRYINIAHEDSHLSNAEIALFFTKLFDSNIRIIGYNLKRDLHALHQFLQ